MPEAIKAALTTDLEITHQSSALSECPSDIQYMPPGTHRINASRGGKPVTLEITVDATTADTLNAFLQAQLTKATEGNDDRPFFDFNHEDREAAAWPTEFYWAGDDLKAGGVRAKIEWSGAGQSAVKEKTFRRFSPTFIPDDQGKVIGSETNMGGLVNRAAFKSIQPLFAKGNLGSPSSSMAASESAHSDPVQSAPTPLPHTQRPPFPQVSSLKLHPSNP
jgi:phage I-like protein